MIKMHKNGEYDWLKKIWKENNTTIYYYADFESILVPENNRKQNLDEAYTNKYWKYVACCYDFKLVCVDEKLSKVSECLLQSLVVFLNTLSWKPWLKSF